MNVCDEFVSFLENKLSRSVPSRRLQQHISDFAARCDAPLDDSPRMRVSCLRQTLLHGLSHKQRFGIPDPLPRIVGLFDLSGEKSLLVSNSVCLLEAAVLGFSPKGDHPRHMRELQTLVQWADANKMGLLCVAVLPWQAGVGWASFEIRTFVDRGGSSWPRVKDGHRYICNHVVGVRDGSASLGDHCDRVGQREVSALADAVCAVSLDDVIPTEPMTERRLAVLEETARRLVFERNLMREESARCKLDEEERIVKAVAHREELAQKQHTQALKVRNECESKIEEANTRTAQALSDLAESKASLGAAMRSNAEMSLQLRECEEKTTRQKKTASQAAQALNRQISQLKSQLKKANDAASHNADYTLQEARREMREGHAYETRALKERINDQGITIQKLAEIIDRKETEFDAQTKKFDATCTRAKEDAVLLSTTLERERQLTAELHATTVKIEEMGVTLMTARACSEESTTCTTGKTTKFKHISAQTCSVGCGTTTVASTQTDTMVDCNEPLSDAEIARAAHRALSKLTGVALAVRSPYVPVFHGHNHVPQFRPHDANITIDACPPTQRNVLGRM